MKIEELWPDEDCDCALRLSKAGGVFVIAICESCREAIRAALGGSRELAEKEIDLLEKKEGCNAEEG